MRNTLLVALVDRWGEQSVSFFVVKFCQSPSRKIISTIKTSCLRLTLRPALASITTRAVVRIQMTCMDLKARKSSVNLWKRPRVEKICLPRKKIVGRWYSTRLLSFPKRLWLWRTSLKRWSCMTIRLKSTQNPSCKFTVFASKLRRRTWSGATIAKTGSTPNA